MEGRRENKKKRNVEGTKMRMKRWM